MVRIDFDFTEITSKLEAAKVAAVTSVRPAVQEGAQIYYDEMRVRVPVHTKGHWFHGTSFQKNGKKYWFNAGSLKSAIYQVYSKDNSGEAKATYHVAWNHKKVPYGFMVEYGTSRTPAHPFLRPAYAAKHTQAESAVREGVYRRVKNERG